MWTENECGQLNLAHGWRDGRLSWPRWLDYAPVGSRDCDR